MRNIVILKRKLIIYIIRLEKAAESRQINEITMTERLRTRLRPSTLSIGKAERLFDWERARACVMLGDSLIMV